MAITETTRPYETLIRHNPDGSIGAHHQRLYEVVKDGTVLSSQIQPPVQLSVAGEEGLPLAEILSETTAAALLATEAAQIARATAEAELAAVKAQLDAAAAAATVLQKKLTAAGEELATSRQQLEAAQAELAALKATPQGGVA